MLLVRLELSLNAIPCRPCISRNENLPERNGKRNAGRFEGKLTPSASMGSWKASGKISKGVALLLSMWLAEKLQASCQSYSPPSSPNLNESFDVKEAFLTPPIVHMPQNKHPQKVEKP